MGYREVSSSDKFHRDLLSTEWDGPERIWVKDEFKGLEKAIEVIMVSSFIIGIFFLSSNITGYAISNTNSTTSNWIGIILIIIGIIISLIYVKKGIK